MEKQDNTLYLTNSENNKTHCEIDLIGGGITHLYIDGKQIFYTGPRPDGGKAFTHPCIPNFNIADDLPNHGPARKEAWTQINDQTISWEMTEIEGIYPKGIKATREFNLQEKAITVTTTIENDGSSDLPINIAEHCYFACPKDKVKDVKVNGNSFHKEALLANAQFNPWQDNNILEIPEIGKLEFITSGYHAFAEWTQPEAPFACVEPIQIMPPQADQFMELAPKLKTGQKQIFRYTIKLQ